MALLVYESWPHILVLQELWGYTVLPPSIEPDGSSSSTGADDSSSDAEEDTEQDHVTYLKMLDPKDWKDHDHYAILGLKRLRHKATEGQIKKAYRKLVLTHHPDKRRTKGEQIEDDTNDFFTCINKAFEILGNSEKRVAYDSVDPMVDDTVPTTEESQQSDFFPLFGPIFQRNARWSIRQPVPDLGNDSSPFEEVEKFYNFWYNFDTWREFSYMDEEKDKAECREERKFIEKNNRVDRARRRNEELRRIRQLVECAHSCDPRVQRYEQAEREAKESKKRAKQEEQRRRREEQEQRAREEREREEREQAELLRRRKEEMELNKAQKEAARKQARLQKRRLKQLVEDRGHFLPASCLPNSNDTDGAKTKVMMNVDLLCSMLTTEELEELNKQLSELDVVQGYTLFQERVTQVESEGSKSRDTQPTAAAPASQPSPTCATTNGFGGPGKENGKWTYEMTQCLIKAVNATPAGTAKRWEVVAAYINNHIPETKLTAKDVLNRAKSLKQSDAEMKKEAGSQAFSALTKQTEAPGAEAVKNVKITHRAETDAPRPWTSEEQRLLEQALRTFTAGADRWERISEAVGTRSKRECMLRCKEIAETVKAKKAAVDSVTAPAAVRTK